MEMLEAGQVDHMIALQRKCLEAGGAFTPTSRQGYLRAFEFQNFCLGAWSPDRAQLLAFCNCSLPTARAAVNFGRGRVAPGELDVVGHLNTMLVHPDCRRQGLASELLRGAMAGLCRRGARHLFVITNPENLASAGLLCAFGFEQMDFIWLHGQLKKLFYASGEEAVSGQAEE